MANRAVNTYLHAVKFELSHITLNKSNHIIGNYFSLVVSKVITTKSISFIRNLILTTKSGGGRVACIVYWA